ncbi:MAG TPA: hypothetical protein VJX29_00650 [Candidatus Acidoferrales bacterium]|nr:hypothetical protein [Candidatus Acidoferrales bacterium]
MRKKLWRGWPILLVLVIAPALALSQAAQQSRTLVVNGQSGQVNMVLIDGHSYVDLESLARTANATLSFHGDQITLTLPVPAAGSPSGAAPPSPPVNAGLSKDFLQAEIEEMAVIREWRSALSNCIENNYPVQEDWVETFRGQAATNLVMAYSAVSTEPDRSAVQLLSNQLDNMNALSDKLLGARKVLHFVSADDFNNDPLNQNILTCAHSLAAMAVSGQFVEDVSCH